MKKVHIEDYDIFKTTRKVDKKILKKLVANIMLYTSIYSSVFLLGDYKLSTKNLENETRIETLQNEDDYLKELAINTSLSPYEKDNQVVFHAVLKNEKLDDNEKELLYNLSDVVSDNPYIDKVAVYNRLKDLDIEYVERPESYNDSVYAIYYYKDNKVYVFNNEENVNLKIALHELIHSIFTNENTIKLPKYIIEGTTQLLTDEYFSSTPFVEKNTYPYEMTMVKILCEMVGSEKVLEAYTTGNMNVILDELSKVQPKEISNEFLNDVNIMFNNFSDNIHIPEATYNSISEYMDKYFSYKYEDNKYMTRVYNYYKNGLNLMTSKNPYDDYSCYLIDNGYYKKSYFCKELERTTNKSFAYNIEDEKEKILVK